MYHSQSQIAKYESHKKYNEVKPIDPFEDPNGYEASEYDLRQRINRMKTLMMKAIRYLADKQEEVTEREIQRKFTIRKAELYPVLDFLMEIKIVEWDKAKKCVALNQDWITQLESFSDELKSHRLSLNRILSFKHDYSL